MEFGAAWAHVLAISTGNASPQNMLTRSLGYMPAFRAPSRFMNTAVDGTEIQIVSRASLINLPGLISVLFGGQHKQAPPSHATNMSDIERSKVMSGFCEKRSS